MTYILDTDSLIYFLKGHDEIVYRIAHTPPEALHTTIINHTELLFGVFNSARKKQNLIKVEAFLNKIPVLSFCKESSYIFAEHKAALKSEGNIIADLDLMIASITLANKMTLVTNNTKHFTRIKDLKIENWTIAN